MAAPSERRRVLARAGRLEYDRVVFFSDAVFAIAITLLIFDLQVPEVAHVESGRQLRDALPRIGGFALSFAVIGLFWMGHHRLFRHIKGLNWLLVLLNLLFLGCIAFLPHPTALLSAAGDQVPATIFYAAAIAAAGLAEAAVWLYAIRIRELALPGISPAAELGAPAKAGKQRRRPG
jgi:TMEM175 potassium channel family protein